MEYLSDCYGKLNEKARSVASINGVRRGADRGGAVPGPGKLDVTPLLGRPPPRGAMGTVRIPAVLGLTDTGYGTFVPQ